MSEYLLTIIGVLFLFTMLGSIRQKLINPLFVFNGIWLCCFILYSLDFSTVYLNEVSLEAFIVIMTMIISFNGFYFLGQCIKYKHVICNVNIFKCDNKYKYIRILFYVWLVMTVAEMIYCQFIPLVWTVLGISGGNYASFGIPSLHGFINSLSWFIINISYIYYLNSHDKRIIKILIIISGVYVLLLARQSMTTEAIQLVSIYALKRTLKFKHFIVVLILGIIIFGTVGNIRTDPMHVLETSGLGYDDVPFFFMGFVWVYLYLMSPIANIISFVTRFDDYMYGVASIGSFLPTVFVDSIDLPKVDTTGYLISETYNVSTALVQPYADFGVLGIIVFFGFLGIIGAKLWKDLRLNGTRDQDVSNYSIYLGILALTFFSNLLLSLPIVMQFVYTNFLFKNYFNNSINGGLSNEEKYDDKRLQI